MVVESEGTKARLRSTEKQLALFAMKNFRLLLDQSGRFELTIFQIPCSNWSEDRTRSGNFRCRKHLRDWQF